MGFGSVLGGARSGCEAPDARRAAYKADVVYLTARELGFDYLRDGLARVARDRVQGAFRSAIVDEADFILIDEARVPLVIAGLEPDGDIAAGGPSAQAGADEARASDGAAVLAADGLARALERDLHFTVDPEGRKVSLTLAGQAAVEAGLGEGGAHEAAAAPGFARVHAALHARWLLERDVDYIVSGGSVRMVDPFTGRIAEGRKWPWGVQPAVEAKEGVPVGPSGRIYGSITVRDLVALYPRLAAMTATAEPAAVEFADSYGVGTVIIPPVKPSRRIDLPDRVFATRAAKMAATADEAIAARVDGMPVLVGTASVRDSEELSEAFKALGVPHAVLNARDDAKEAELVAAAGRKGAVTISTNMAGRGTDIRLDADPAVAVAGGLLVIGTNRHDSRRVDDQLRGRAARQGDPGSSRFFVSLEDELFVRYGVKDFMPKELEAERGLGGLGGEAAKARPLGDPRVSKEIRHAQAVIEGQNSKMRAALAKFTRIVELDRRAVREAMDSALNEGRLPDRVEALLSKSLLPGLRAWMAARYVDALDVAWADHLALAEGVKEGIGLVRYAGKDPGLEYLRILGDAFEESMAGVDETLLVECVGAIEAGGVPDAAKAGASASAPATTWTYAVEADALPGFTLGSLSGAAAAVLGPLALPLFLLGRLASAGGKGRRRASG